MRLAHPFIQLPILCDVERLRQELSAVRPEEWRSHPSKFQGNAGALLVTVGGGQNDDFAQAGQFQPTPLLERLPYVRQIMVALRAPVSRSRFMRLAPGASVPPHDDVGLHWFQRVRVHVPVTTNPGVVFHCRGHRVHMAAGEVWVFDNFETHAVENRGDEPRVHLVIDVVPDAAFRELLERGFRPSAASERAAFRPVPLAFDPSSCPPVPLEVHREQSLSREEIRGLVQEIAADVPRLGLGGRRERSIREALATFESGWTAGGGPALERRVASLLRKVAPAFLGLRGRTRGKDALTVLTGLLFTTNKVSATVIWHGLRLLGPVFAFRVTTSTLRRIVRDKATATGLGKPRRQGAPG